MRFSGFKHIVACLSAVLAAGFLSAVYGQADLSTIQGVYRGKIGQQAIVLEIGLVKENHATNDAEGDQDAKAYPVEGRYFYARHGVGILLKGEPQADGSLALKEYQSMKATGGQWKLTFQGERAQGVFCKCNVLNPEKPGVSQAGISLERVSGGFDPEFEWSDEGKSTDRAYYDLLLEFPLKTGPEIRAGNGIAYAMRTDVRYSVSLPHLTRFPDAAVMDRVNTDLENELRLRRLRAAGCLFEGQLFSGGQWEEKTRVALFSRNLLSIVHDAMWYCGGAYPDGGSEPLMYNLKTGRPLEMGDVFARASKDSAKSGQVAEGPVHKALLALYLQHHGRSEKGCENVFDDRPPLTFYFDEKGISLEPELAHAIRGCGAAIVVPYGELHGVLREGGLAAN